VTEGVTSVELVAIGQTTERMSLPVVGNRARFVLGPPLTDRVGVISVLVVTAAGPVDATVRVEAGSAVTIDPLAGPRTIVADGADETMIVTVPADERGNPLPDGTPVEIGVVGPDGRRSCLAAATEAGIAAVRFRSGTLAGPLMIAAESGAATGPAVRVDQVAGSPAPFSLHIGEGQERLPTLADGHFLHRMVTSELVDEFGNRLPDGVSVDVSTESPEGPGRLVAVVTGGRAQFDIEAPALPGRVTVGATIDGVAGVPITLSFTGAVSALPVEASARDGSVVVTVGPVLDQRGAFVPDGTVATIASIRTVIQNGYAVAHLEEPTPPRWVTVSVLGTIATAPVRS
ncbi:MAG: hypothetical protein OEV40_27875, partial [Acidimicrobiia bacterium]|nr:hypothetical protein [Acidimicrobiia bacterium]